jgi:hypothetical protein
VAHANANNLAIGIVLVQQVKMVVRISISGDKENDGNGGKK